MLGYFKCSNQLNSSIYCPHHTTEAVRTCYKECLNSVFFVFKMLNTITYIIYVAAQTRKKYLGQTAAGKFQNINN